MKTFFATVLTLFACFSLASAQSDRTIHFFGVFCNAYEGIGGDINEGVSADQIMLDTVFTEYFSEQSWGVGLRRVQVIDQGGTKANIEAEFEAFLASGIGPEDTVWVHFSGHGTILDPAKGEQFLQTIDEELISREKWAERLDALPCKLKILITDCCSTYPPEFVVAEGDEKVEPWQNLYSLLLEHQGFVDITAASPGNPAYGTANGGFLTINLESDMQRFRSWQQVFDSTRQRVFIETGDQIRAANLTDLEPQTPVAHSIASPTFNPEVKPPVQVEYVLPDSALRYLTYDELVDMGLQQLYLARNEIFARHGYDFNSAFLQEYFASRSWYNVIPGFKSPNLSDIETANSTLIRQVETDLGGPFIAGKKVMPGDNAGDAPADIFSYSSNRSLSRSVLQNLTPAELSIARNEIYARHGYPFSSPTLRNYFSQKPYYSPVNSKAEPNFNSVEKHNLWLIRKVERINGGAYQW